MGCRAEEVGDKWVTGPGWGVTVESRGSRGKDW